MAAVSNTFSDIAPKIVARALEVLRPRLILPQIANKDYNTGVSQFGDTINVPVPYTTTPLAVVPNNISPTPISRTVETVPVVVDQWFRDDFALTDQDLQKINKDETFVPMGLDVVVDGLATKINQSLWELYYRFHLAVGDAGVTPFVTDYAEAAKAKRFLSESKAPKGGRILVMNFAAEEQATQLSEFADTSASGDNKIISEGEIGRKIGMDWFADDDVPLHTVGSLTGTIVVSGAHSVGATSILLATDAAEAIALKQGDIISFDAAETEPYAVQADLTVGATSSGSVTISPALITALAGAEACILTTGVAGGKGGKFDADARMNLALHPSALVFVSRTSHIQSEVDKMAGAQVFSLSDPVSGVTLRLELIRQFMQNMWNIDALWGRAVHRPELGVRILGEST